MQTVHVAVGLIVNANDQVLIARRAAHQHQGNKWEFPGGKLEQGETAQEALSRELKEELGINVLAPEYLFDIPYQYESKQVVLFIYLVKQWQGEVSGKEGQPIRWVNKEALKDYIFPDANESIISFLLSILP